MIARLDGDTVRLEGASWWGAFPLSELPAKVTLYRTLRNRRGGRYAASYAPTVAALEDVAAEAGVPLPPEPE